MEINVGDYVRYKEFSYDKEVKIGNKVDVFGNVDTSRGRILEHNIIKHSKDIIDLIEVGDIIEFKEDNDLYRVNCIPNEECGCNCFYLEFNYAEKYDVEDIMVDKEYMKTYLKSVLIKEQFESNAYTIEKER